MARKNDMNEWKMNLIKWNLKMSNDQKVNVQAAKNDNTINYLIKQTTKDDLICSSQQVLTRSTPHTGINVFTTVITNSNLNFKFNFQI